MKTVMVILNHKGNPSPNLTGNLLWRFWF